MIEATGKAKQKAQQKMLLKLLRLLLRADCRIAADDHEKVRIEADGQCIDFTPATFAFAVSNGLLVRRGSTVAATAQARAFWRRMMSGSDEMFSAQHRDIAHDVALVEGARQSVRRNLKESPLAALTRLKDRGGEPFLSTAAVDAGGRLANDFTRGQMQPRITASWEPRLEVSGGGRTVGGEISDSAMAARDRFSRAVEAMGPELSGVAIDVCCFEKGLEMVERERLWPARSAKLMLRAALLALARHYSPPVAEGGRRHHWGDGDFRPRM